MTHTINLNHITKIEGHASLYVEIKDNKVMKCRLSSIEGSRYFEGLLKGKHYFEAHEISSRICGVCSCAHTVAAVTAMENALNIKTTKQTKELKKLLTLGERIRSHAAHLYFLALPDYLGYESALAMLPKYRKEVKSALRLMKLGNKLVKVVGGRDLHPVSLTVGGFLKIPTKDQLIELANDINELQPDAFATAKLFGSLDIPDIENDCEYFSLHDEKEFPILEGNLISAGSTFKQSEYLDYFKEYHEPYSTANFVVREDKSYLVGAISRINNNYNKLSKDAKRAITTSKIKFPSKNPFANNFAQAVELVHCLDHSIEICNELYPRQENPIQPKLKASRGLAAIEVPRGILFHDYTLDKKGIITKANIITPTAQNLKNMEDNIKKFIPSILHLKNEEKINLEIEKLIRSYDPCFSCSTHFLKVKWDK
ncbi:MAG: Ni/Fe hydrogenase subunit alpha [Nanoarchaeota archaeon]